MKIALFHELPYGGARRAVLEYGRELSKDNIVDLFYIDESSEKNIKDIFHSIKFIKFIPVKWSGKNWKAKLYKDTVELFKLYLLHKKIAKLIDEKEYDFVFIHGSKYTQTPFISRFLKTYSIYYCQEPLRMVYEELFDIPNDLSIWKKYYERFNRNNRRLIDKSNIFQIRLLLANSNFTKKNIKKAYKLDSTVLYMGVDMKRFFPVKTKKIFDILFVGSMDDIDGYKLLQDSISLMKVKPKVRYLLREKEWISNDAELRKLYSQSKLLICLAYKEPFGLLPIEAQACGTPVVAVKEGGYLDSVLDGQTGIFVKRNPMDISRNLTKILKDNSKLDKLGRASRENVIKNWSWKVNTFKLMNLVKEN